MIIMGNKIIKTDNIERYGIVSFLCDTEADISKIDINNYNSGCRIYCIENKKNYIFQHNPPLVLSIHMGKLSKELLKITFSMSLLKSWSTILDKSIK